jgi:uncharacterized protein YcbX
MASLSRISVYPIKSLDPVDLDRASITGVGGLESDRAYAMVDDDGAYVNGKRTAEVHRLEADVDPAVGRVTLRVRGETDVRGDAGARDYHLDHDRAAIEAYLSEYFGVEITLEAGPGGSRTDGVVYGDSSRTGPTLISAATLRAVASWYEGIDAAEMRLRLRPNLVIEGVPAFREDRLATTGEGVRIGDTTLEGVDLVPRCVVPARDPRTSELDEGFEETFRERRAETLPEWSAREDFEGDFYKVMALTRIPEGERDGELAVGDEVQLLDED